MRRLLVVLFAYAFALQAGLAAPPPPSTPICRTAAPSGAPGHPPPTCDPCCRLTCHAPILQPPGGGGIAICRAATVIAWCASVSALLPDAPAPNARARGPPATI